MSRADKSKAPYERDRCKACGAHVIYATIEGKQIPLDPLRVMTYDDLASEHPLLGADWRRRGSLFVGHHATCAGKKKSKP